MDVEAVNIYLQFNLGWFANPIVYGDWPAYMKKFVTDGRLVPWTEEEKSLITGAYDFFGMDHYTSVYVQYTGLNGSCYANDSRTTTYTSNIHGVPIGP